MDKKKIAHVAACVLAAIVICFIVAVFSPNRCKLYEDKVVTVSRGSSVMDIANLLKKEKVISGKTGFIVRTLVTGKRDELKYGEFTFSPGMSYGEVIDLLTSSGAKRETVTVAIPEGFSVQMIIKKCVESGLGTYEGFEKALDKDYDYKFLEHLEVTAACDYKLQGFLFPSTYEFYKDASEEAVIDTMLKEFEKQYSKLSDSYEGIYEVITKASLVEREAKLDVERPLIAGVIENRLEIGMKLQIDAAVVYAISNGMYDVERVLYKDLEIDSKYNLYKYEGLPAGPIGNPGLKSIEAVLSPAEHKYLYYHTDTEKNDGSHIFSETFREHKQ